MKKLNQDKIGELNKLAKLVRYFILQSTTKAGSGHPTSSLSATDLMVGLMFGGFFRFEKNKPNYHNNDRLIFSKGHAAPLFYSLWAAAGKVTYKELLTLRKFSSKLEGHPTMQFPYTEAATGSLGQGLSIGLGMALNAKYIDKLPYKTYVLLGDSEMAEGSNWEAMQLAAYYKLNNLIGIIDVNRLGQRGETMLGHKISIYAERVKSFGWRVITIDGHSWEEINNAYEQAGKEKKKPVMIIAKTLKGKGIKLLENKNNWHGKALKSEQLKKALLELGNIDKKIEGKMLVPKKLLLKKYKSKSVKKAISVQNEMSTREAYGHSLVRIFNKFPNIVSLDAEVSNSTFAEIFNNKYPKNFFEMFIAEQNMVGAAIGLSKRNKIPFVSTFAAFFSRAYDQIRMSQYSESNIKFVGSHAGVSIGEDGASQMALEDISMFRALFGSTVLYPSDAISTDKLVELAARKKGIVYLRTTRSKTPNLYKKNDRFKIGGSKVLKKSKNDRVTIITAGITVHEALAAYEDLSKRNINIRIIDLYSIKPIDKKTIEKSLKETSALIIVEDHYPEGGIGEAVKSVISTNKPVISLAVRKMPKTGKMDQLLDYEEISKRAIIKEVLKIK
ncbi:MAG: transketolase [Candidatus Kerfeldbacteria bacterium]